MGALRAAASDCFIRSVAMDARRRLPGCCSKFSDEQLFSLCEAGIAMASRYAVGAQEDVILFLDVVIAHGVAFADSDTFRVGGSAVGRRID